jgi:hypothetical protein
VDAASMVSGRWGRVSSRQVLGEKGLRVLSVRVETGQSFFPHEPQRLIQCYTRRVVAFRLEHDLAVSSSSQRALREETGFVNNLPHEHLSESSHR